MPLVNLARDMLSDAIIGGTTYNKLNNANAHLGVGTSTTAHAASQTDLVATGGNQFRKGMDASYPQRSANVITFRSTFASGEANFAWAEWGIFNASTSGQMYSRKVEALGTKASGSTWELTVTSTITI